MDEIYRIIDLTKGHQYFKIPKFDQQKSQFKIYEKVEEPVDEMKELKDILSDFVTTEFLKNDNTRSLFVGTICNIFNKSITYYKKIHGLNDKDILFLYKGGNILRLEYNNFKNKLPCYVSNDITDIYDNYFKLSDADFTIYINPNLNNFDMIHDHISSLTYLLCNYVRCIIGKKLSSYFDYFKYTTSIKEQHLLKNVLDKLNQAKLLNDEKSQFYNGKFIKIDFDIDSYQQIDMRSMNDVKLGNEKGNDLENNFFSPYKSDFSIVDNPSDSKTMIFYTQTNEDFLKKLSNLSILCENSINKFMYISNNNIIRFETKGGTIYFDLIRVKINFKIYFLDSNNNIRIHNIGGELIDITIPKKIDYILHHFYTNPNVFSKKYNVTINENKVSFTGYSTLYLVEDLERILFTDVNYPWEDKKYVKRLNRLMLLYFFEIVINNNDKLDRIIKSLKKLIIVTELSKQTGKKIINLNKHQQIFEHIIKVINTTSHEIYRDHLFEFIDAVKFNLDNFIKYLEKITFAEHTENFNIYENDEVNVAKWGGNYYNKYLKYKTKYLKYRVKN
jgi:hypothetical protein